MEQWSVLVLVGDYKNPNLSILNHIRLPNIFLQSHSQILPYESEWASLADLPGKQNETTIALDKHKQQMAISKTRDSNKEDCCATFCPSFLFENR